MKNFIKIHLLKTPHITTNGEKFFIRMYAKCVAYSEWRCLTQSGLTEVGAKEFVEYPRAFWAIDKFSLTDDNIVKYQNDAAFDTENKAIEAYKTFIKHVDVIKNKHKTRLQKLKDIKTVKRFL